MRIALVTDGIFPYVIGGMQKHSFYLAKYLAKNNIDVDLYHTNQSSKDIELLDGFSENEKKHIHSIVVDFPDSGKFPGHYLRDSFRYSCKLFDEFEKRSDVDFIYSKGFAGWRFAQEKANRKLAIPLGVNFHGYEMFQPAPSFKSYLEQVLFFRNPVKYILKHADFLFSYGGKITNIIHNLGVPKKKIIEIPAGIEESWLRCNIKLTEKKKRFIFVGRSERRKGVAELMDVLKDIAFNSEMDFYFVGPIPEKLKVNIKGICYIGALSDSERLREILDTCDVLVCPSYSEGMPNVILEAMARGLAVIATDVGAISEMVSTDNGWCIPPKNFDGLKTAIESAINLADEELNNKKETSLHLIAENFLWDEIVKLTIASIEASINGSLTD